MEMGVSVKLYEVCYLVGLALAICYLLYQYLYIVILMVLCWMSLWLYRRTQVTWVGVNGQGILITGCDSGFGYYAAERFHDSGFTVIAGVLNMDSKGAQKLRKKKSKRVHMIRVDITSDTEVQEAVQYIQGKRLRLWGIVSNAGINFPGEVELTTVEQFNKVADVNLYGGIRVVKAFLPFIRQSKGRVVMVSSARGLYSWPGESAYIITKHGVETFADSLRLEMRKFGVKVVVVQPGDFDGATEIMAPVQLDRIRQEFDSMWTHASDEVKSTYGEEYLENMFKVRKSKMSDVTPISPDPVTDAIQEALFRDRPSPRYLVGGTSGIVDVVGVFATFYNVLPESITDKFIELWTR
ncbi:D-beta-hydroxybutyrate dehydrogenase, mitochondrial-like isoform X2 [Argopecten irradians]